jgi:hypothetical protein
MMAPYHLRLRPTGSPMANGFRFSGRGAFASGDLGGQARRFQPRMHRPRSCAGTSPGRPGAVEIALNGKWANKTIGLTGGAGADFSHAKIGVSTAGNKHFVIFGDMNQQGSLSGPNCGSSQNGRGGLFYVIDNKNLSDSVAPLIAGETGLVAQNVELGRMIWDFAEASGRKPTTSVNSSSFQHRTESCFSGSSGESRTTRIPVINVRAMGVVNLPIMKES